MEILSRLCALFRRDKLDRDMAAEMRAHLEEQTRRNLAAGMNERDAHAAAHRQFGGVAQIQERARDARGWRWLEDALRDLRLAARTLRQHPGFTTVAVLSLALGIGANTAVFSLVDDVLWKMLPVKNPQELVLLHWFSGPQGFDVAVSGSWDQDPETGRTSCTSFSQRAFERFRDENQALREVFAFAPLREPTLIANGQAELSSFGAQVVSGGYHAGLGVSAVLGRTIARADDQPGAPPVAVISYGYWQRRFGGGAGVLGKTIVVNNASATIIGVTPPEFLGTLDVGIAPDVTLPLSMLPQVDAELAEFMRRPGGIWWLRVMGRLHPGATPEQVRGNLGEVFRQLAREDLQARPPHGPVTETVEKPDLPELAVGPGSQGLNNGRTAYRQRLMILLGLVGIVLLIASANVATLLLARGAARRREIAARLALGASRSRLIRQLLTESALLAFLGAGAGLLFALWGKRLLLAMNLLAVDGPETLVLNPGLDWRVLGFTAFVALGTGLFFALVPAWQSTRLELSSEFQGGTRLHGASRSRLGRALLVLQVALSLMLLVGAGLFVRTVRNLEGIEVGFNREHLLLFRINAKPPAYDRARAARLHEQIAERIGALSGVRGVTFSRMPLLSRAGWGTRIRVPGRGTGAEPADFAMLNAVGPDFFSTLGIPVLLGREFAPRDDTAAPGIALINETMAKRYFPEGNPVGQQFGRPSPHGNVDVEIIGVVGDAKYTEARNETPPTAYFPFRQEPDGEGNYAVRTSGDPEGVVAAIREVARTIDPTLPLGDIRTQDAQIRKLFASKQLFARFASFFGGLALALVCVGLYGQLAYAVTRRTGEIGVRMALGAKPRWVLGMILRQSLGLVAVGVGLGLAGAIATTRLVASMLYDLSPNDPATLAGTVLLIIVATTLAAWLPARRAANVDPVVALRAE